MSYDKRKTLFMFLDEAGNLDFSPTGTEYWSLTAICTFEPMLDRGKFWEYLYSLADVGEGQEYFHATTDRQGVRDEIFKMILGLPDDFHIHSIIAEKRKAHPSLYLKWVTRGNKKKQEKNEDKFYDLICRVLLQYIFKNKKCADAERIVIVLSSIFTNVKHESLKGSLKIHLKQHTKVPFSIYFHQTKADINCQLADYCGWAITVKWERKEMRSYDLIRAKVKSEFPVFRMGFKNHY